MTSLLEFVLSPLIWFMGYLLDLYSDLSGSVGIAIFLLAATLSLLTQPIRVFAGRIETRIANKIARVDALKDKISPEYKGEQRFNEIENIYKEEKYHPIQSVLLSSSILVVLPLLISAFFLFTSKNELLDTGFLFISNLSESDKLLFGINLLPFLMTLLNIIDANFRFRSDRKAKHRFYFIAAVLFALVYTMPSSLILYWTGSNAAYLCFWLFAQLKGANTADRGDPSFG